jgi:hypothetical protein
MSIYEHKNDAALYIYIYYLFSSHNDSYNDNKSKSNEKIKSQNVQYLSHEQHRCEIIAVS